METFFIKIDLESIKKNENVGSTITVINTGKIVKFKASYLPDVFVDGENCFIHGYKTINGNISEVEGIITKDELIQKIIDEKIKGISIDIDFHNQTIEHEPVPEYSFNYENTKVECRECRSEFMSDELVSDVDTYDENYSDTICPKCGEFYSCDLVYEKIEDAIKRRN